MVEHGDHAQTIRGMVEHGDHAQTIRGMVEHGAPNNRNAAFRSLVKRLESARKRLEMIEKSSASGPILSF